MVTSSYADLATLLLIGESGVGKTCLVRRLRDGTFTEEYTPTLGLDLSIISRECDGKLVSLHIADTTGKKSCPSVSPPVWNNLHRHADCILLVYDVTDQESFNYVKYWLERIEVHVRERVNKLIVGNKCDLNQHRVVSSYEAWQFACSVGIPFMETSAKSATNVEEALQAMVRELRVRVVMLALENVLQLKEEELRRQRELEAKDARILALERELQARDAARMMELHAKDQRILALERELQARAPAVFGGQPSRPQV